MTDTLTVTPTEAPGKAEVTVITDNFQLTANDRCDACGAQGYFQVTLASGDLIFCAHHYRGAESKFLVQALRVRDESAKLK